MSSDPVTERWLYHVLLRDDVGAGGAAFYAPASLAREGFLHASYAPAVLESAALYFPKGSTLIVFQIDPRAIGDVTLAVAATPRGPMPHIEGAIPRAAIVAVRTLAQMGSAPDAYAVRDG